MDIDSSGLRQRKNISKLVEDLDIFDKVVDNVKEESKASSGFIAFVCFATIFLLFCSETNQFFFTKKFDYRFTVDTAMDEMPVLDIDMVIATPCSSLQVVSSMEQYAGIFAGLDSSISKDPTRFEFTDEEQMYWTILRHAHAQYNKEGLRAVEQFEYVDDDVESTLEHLAEQKQKKEVAELAKQREKTPATKSSGNHGQVMFFIQNGAGMFQIVADNSKGEDEGTACRVHGKFQVRKGKEEKVVITISNPLMMFDHDSAQGGNISHRIEKFNFGPRIPGLVTPLAGAEHISESGQDIYRYFIKVVPTRIYGYFSSKMTYQYSVTFLKTKLKEGEHSHGGILFEYEFTANVIEVRKASITFFNYIIRVCSILGGVYATSTIVNNIVQFFLSFIYLSNDKRGGAHETRSHTTMPSAERITDSQRASLIMDIDIKVH